MLSINTLRGRIRVAFDVPKYFEKYFKEPWIFGVGKIVSLKNEWYLHISMTKEIEEKDAFSREEVKHVVGIDRDSGLSKPSMMKKVKHHSNLEKRFWKKELNFKKCVPSYRQKGQNQQNVP